jgi:hypothetical protein
LLDRAGISGYQFTADPRSVPGAPGDSIPDPYALAVSHANSHQYYSCCQSVRHCIGQSHANSVGLGNDLCQRFSFRLAFDYCQFFNHSYSFAHGFGISIIVCLRQPERLTFSNAFSFGCSHNPGLSQFADCRPIPFDYNFYTQRNRAANYKCNSNSGCFYIAVAECFTFYNVISLTFCQPIGGSQLISFAQSIAFSFAHSICSGTRLV